MHHAESRFSTAFPPSSALTAAEVTIPSEAVQSAEVPLQELPCPSAMAEAYFTWGPDEVSAEQFNIQSTNTAYAEVVIISFLFHLGGWARHL